MGGFRTFLTTVSWFFTLAALALAVFAAVGSVDNKSKAIDTIHFIRLDFSSIDLSSIISDSSVASTLSSAAKSITFKGSDFGFANTYTFSYWGYCQSDDSSSSNNLKYDSCSSAKALYYVDPEKFLQEQLDKNKYSTVITQLVGTSGLNVSLPGDMEDYVPTIKAVSYLIFICTFIGIGAFGLQFLNNFVAKRSHLSSVLSFLLGALGTTALLLAAAGATGMWLIVKEKFNKKLADTGITATIDPEYYGLIWGSFGAGLLSTFGWMFAICCGRTEPHYDYDEVKE